jgi:hypothetical protein
MCAVVDAHAVGTLLREADGNAEAVQFDVTVRDPAAGAACSGALTLDELDNSRSGAHRSIDLKTGSGDNIATLTLVVRLL